MICKACGEENKHKAHGVCQKCYNAKYNAEHIEERSQYMDEHREERLISGAKYRAEHREERLISGAKYRAERGGKSASENKRCTLFLGVHVAEQVLSKVFKNVERMPPNHKGFDFICNKGKKIDVKSSCTRTHDTWSDSWMFTINRNIIADYFLCLAFNNRADLTPLYIWLIP